MQHNIPEDDPDRDVLERILAAGDLDRPCIAWARQQGAGYRVHLDRNRITVNMAVLDLLLMQYAEAVLDRERYQEQAELGQ